VPGGWICLFARGISDQCCSVILFSVLQAGWLAIGGCSFYQYDAYNYLRAAIGG
jgi:hypothetical protein